MATAAFPMYPPPPPPVQLTGIKEPTHHDVKSGRGVSTNSWPGNERFRSLVNCNKELYVTSTKRQKMSISRSIVEAVRSLDPPGRFLEKNPDTGLWSDIGDKKAIEKTSQALRDGAAALRKQLSADMNDPDFLSAVFDTNAPIPEAGNAKKKTAASGKKKGKPPAKGHRRVKSNPTTGTAARTKALLKKVRSSEHHGGPASPKSLAPRPPQSPLSSPGAAGRSSPGYERSNQDIFRRPQNEGRYEYPGSPTGHDYPGLPPRSASFDYHDLDRGGYYESPRERSPPMTYGHYSSPASPSGYRVYDAPRPYPMASPRMHGPPPPPSPGAGPMGSPRAGPMASPLPPGRYRFSPNGYRNGPPSPRVAWSPRQLPHHPGGPPSPYLHSFDTPPSYRSPERRPMLSPRMSYSHDPGRISPGLAVPTLGGECDPHAHSPPSPMWREPNPYYSPREGHPPPPNAEFLPPPPPPPRHRPPGRHDYLMYASPESSMENPRYPESAESHGYHPREPQGVKSEPYDEEPMNCQEDEPRDYSYEKNEQPEQQTSEPTIPQRDESRSYPTPSPPVNLKIEESFDSPNGIADLDRATTPMEEGFEVSLPPEIEQQLSKDSSENYPFDETNPAADDVDNITMSPLPFDGREDPMTLMELPENLLKLPISPVGPQDDSSQDRP